MFLFIASEAALFGSFFAAYFFIRVVNPEATIIEPEKWQTWPPEPYEFPVFVAGVNTAILVTSSFTMHWACSPSVAGTGAASRRGSWRRSCSASPSCSRR